MKSFLKHGNANDSLQIRTANAIQYSLVKHSTKLRNVFIASKKIKVLKITFLHVIHSVFDLNRAYGEKS